MAGTVIQGIQQTCAEFPGEEQADVALNGDVDAQAAKSGGATVGRGQLGRGQVSGNQGGQILEPLSDFGRGILGAWLVLEQLIGKIIDAGEDLWIERADRSEAFG